MAEKKKGLYSRKLKDVNKDGKKNFADTWLGDMIGADGKVGIGKGRPGLRESLAGARREDGKADTTAKKAKKTGKTKKSDYKDTTDDARAARTRSSTKKTSSMPKRSKTDSRSSTSGSTRVTPQRPTTGVGSLSSESKPSIDTSSKVTRAQKTAAVYKQKVAERDKQSPGKSFSSWFQANKEKYKKEGGGYNNAEALKDFNKMKSGMSKGGMTKKRGYSKGGSVSRTGHTDHRKTGMFRK